MTRPAPTPPGEGPIAERRRLAARGRAAFARIETIVGATDDTQWRERFVRGLEALANEYEEINEAMKERTP